MVVLPQAERQPEPSDLGVEVVRQPVDEAVQLPGLVVLAGNLVGTDPPAHDQGDVVVRRERQIELPLHREERGESEGSSALGMGRDVEDAGVRPDRHPVVEARIDGHLGPFRLGVHPMAILAIEKPEIVSHAAAVRVVVAGDARLPFPGRVEGQRPRGMRHEKSQGRRHEKQSPERAQKTEGPRREHHVAFLLPASEYAGSLKRNIAR